MKEIGNTVNPVTNTTHDDKAVQKLWLREGPGEYTSAGIPRSSRTPLTHRTWYRYEGQGTSAAASMNVGTQSNTTYVVQMVRDKGQAPGTSNPTLVESTHAYTYNSEGMILTEKDPVGRETKYYYDTNNIDLLKVKQVESGVERVVAAFDSYTSYHVPTKTYDAGGNLTQLTFNDIGQIRTRTDPEGVVTEWLYTGGSKGFLDKVRRKNDSGTWVTLYDVTQWNTTYKWPTSVIVDADGYEIDIEYDYLDRVTKVTHPDNSYQQTIYTDNGLAPATNGSSPDPCVTAPETPHTTPTTATGS